MPLQRPSRRRFLGAVGVAGIASVGGCASRSSSPQSSPAWESDEWTVAHGSPTNSGHSRLQNTPRSNTTVEEWKLYRMVDSQAEEDAVRYGLLSSPVVADGTVFVATGLPGGHGEDEDGRLFALDATTEKIEWRKTLPKGGSGTPAIADGLVFVGSNDRALTAFDTESGSVEWRTTTSAPVTTPAVAGGNVYVGDGAGSVHAFRRTDGKLRWRYGQRTLGSLGSFLSDKKWTIRGKPAVTGDTVYVTTGIGGHDYRPSEYGGNLVALSRSDGEERWRYEYEPGDDYATPRAPVVANGLVFVASGALHAVDASDGTRRWKYNTGYETTSAPAVHDGTVYFSAKNVYALSAEDGKEQWRFVNLAGAGDSYPYRVPMESKPVVTDETVYVGAGALDAATGEKLWGDLGNRKDKKYFASIADDGNASVEGPAITGQTVYMPIQYGAILRVTEVGE